MAYVREQNLENALDRAVKTTVQERAPDGIARCAELLCGMAPSISKEAEGELTSARARIDAQEQQLADARARLDAQEQQLTDATARFKEVKRQL